MFRIHETVVTEETITVSAVFKIGDATRS